MKKIIHSFVMLLLANSILFAYWECPSQLGANLNQFRNSNFLWGVELTEATGYLADNAFYNGITLLGLNYSSNSHSLYFEGGIKSWYRYNHKLPAASTNTNIGIRELFYRNQSRIGLLTLGVQSMRSQDIYLLNERVLGLSYKKDFNKFSIDIFGGTVSNVFARNGIFCNTAYLYNILPHINQTTVGISLGETNMSGITLSYHPSQTQNNPLENLENTEPESFLKVETVGIILYSEFGSLVPNRNFITGIYSDIEFGNEYRFKPEILISQSEDRSLIYCAEAKKTITWGNQQRTTFETSYYGLSVLNSGRQEKYGESKNGESETSETGRNKAKSTNLFSNTLAGTVLRFDSPEMPFLQIAARHTVPSLKAHLKLQYTCTIQSHSEQEIDFEIGKKFFGKLLVNATYGYINSPQLLNISNLVKLELRFNF